MSWKDVSFTRVGSLGMATLAAVAAGLALAPRPVRALPDDYALVERGRDLATIGDCVACHTPPGAQPFSGGRDLKTPFGVIKSANLTPDVATGLGSWSADDFYRAMHDGTRPDGTRLYPAFPYPYYTKATRSDSDAIFAFLQRLPPKANPVNRNTLPFPFDIRSVMIAWNALYFTPGEFKPDPTRSAVFNRGAYLTEGLGHCGACHTPLNRLGANEASHPFEGNVIQGWTAPNITNDTRVGLGNWSLGQIIDYLKVGHNTDAAASGPMAEVVSYSTSAMSDADLQAIAVYLKERGGAAGAAPTAVSTQDAHMKAGAAIYADTCMACHKADGSGVELLFPRLAGAPVTQQHNLESLVRVVIQGSRSAATRAAPTAPAMPSLGWRLSDDQIADVLTYIRNSWGNQASAVSSSDVESIRKQFALRAEK